jgi:HSP20 family molecular chaperone IbpA
MPGVSKDRLNIHVEGENLVLEGRVLFEMPEQAQALYADVRSTLYRCSFVLSRELEADQIRANLKDGVLQVRIPKRAEVKPRRITVES